MTNWKTYRWGDIATLEYGKSLRDYRTSSGNVPVYGTNGQVGYTEKALCNFPSVIIGRKGAYRGVHYSSKPFFVIDTAFYLKPFSGDLDLKFAYYNLILQDINGLDSGSAIPSTRREDFYELEVNLPNLPTQRRIAEILSALDDKIELNRRMNQTLEQMAQTLFRQYFVDGIDEENLPEGWKLGEVGKVSSIQNGYAFKSKDFQEEGIKGVIKIKNINNNNVDIHSTQFIGEQVANTIHQKFKVKSGDILIAMTGAEVGKIGIVPSTEKSLWLNQRVGSFKEKVAFGNYFTFILLTSEAYQEELRTTAMGSAQPNISGSDIEAIKCVLPPIEQVSEFGEKVKPIFDKICSNLHENYLLSNTRDSLLPKLMSGEIDVMQTKPSALYEPVLS